MPFKIIRNDITKVKADAIVNTANPLVGYGRGVDEKIYKAAGEKQLLEARKKIGALRPGEIGVSDGFDLNCKYIIHVSCPVWIDGKHNEKDALGSCYEKALDMAYQKGCNTIAFPLLSTGNYGFPKEVGLDIAISAFTSFLEDHEMEIILVVFDKKATLLSKELFNQIDEYIDDDFKTNLFVKEDLEVACFGCSSFNEDQLEDILKDVYKESFGKYLRGLINRKGLKNSSVYTKANISKQYFSKILNDQIKPSKEKMLALAIGLELNIDETIDFLSFAGYALSPISQTDKVVEFFIKHKQYSVIKIDMALFDYGLDPLSN